MSNVLLAALAFILTFLENAVGAQETRAVTKLKSKQAAHWSLAFELILWLDLYLLVRGGFWLILPIGLGAWLGTYWSVETKKRRMLRRRHEKAQVALAASPADGPPSPGQASAQ